MQFDRLQYIYFITFDYYSAFFEVDKLETTDFRTVVEKLKMQFNLHGIPEIVVSNNSPKYDSCEFSKLAEFSAYNPQSNGNVESAVKIHESITKKAARGNFDPYLSLLDYRNTPKDVGSSPAQRLLSRRTRNRQSLTPKKLEPVTVPPQDGHQRLIASGQKQAYYYNLKGKVLPELQPSQIIRMKKPNESTLTVCKKMIGPWSYAVVSGNRNYRRNRRQLRLVPPTEQVVSGHVSSKQSGSTDGSQVLNQCALPTKNSEGPKPVSAYPNATVLPGDLASNSIIKKEWPYCRASSPFSRSHDLGTFRKVTLI